MAADDTAATFEARVVALRPEAESVLCLTLQRADGGPLPAWEPGAHIDLVLPAVGVERQYSLCGDPSEPGTWTVGVLREPEGRGGSEWIHTALRPGDRLHVRGPRNGFAFVDAPRYLFIAGGIGITPLLPMLERAAAQGADWRLLYGGRTRSAMAFLDRVLEHAGHVTVWPQDEHGLLDLEAALGRPDGRTAVYCCGPEALIAAVEERCRSWPTGALHVERFAPRPGALDGDNRPFEVVLARSGLTVAVAADQSIAEAVEAAGVAVATSCREGTCGTCETDVVEGEIDHRDSFLAEDERADGSTMMICCSRARSGRLVLDL